MVSPSFSQFSGLPCELINCGKQTDQRMRRQEEKTGISGEIDDASKSSKSQGRFISQFQFFGFQKKNHAKIFFSNQGLTYLFIFEVHTWCSVGEKGIDINVGKALRELY